MRGTFMKQPRRRRVVSLIPNILTTGNLFSGLASILFVFGGNFEAAAIAILVAIVFDVLDGTTARLMKSTSDFGLQYDSLGDVVSFGVAPGLLVFVWALSTPKMLGAAVMFAFVACGALRLARHNVLATTNNNEKPFTGLPIPGAAGVIATLVIFDQHVVSLGESVKPILGIVLTLSLAFLMVSTFRYRSLKEEHHHFNYLVYAVLILMAVLAYPQAMLFVVFAAYALSGVVEQGWKFVVGMTGEKAKNDVTSDELPK
jgi:CDP-diacylglycerol--serine O-phosphatidyltransferase